MRSLGHDRDSALSLVDAEETGSHGMGYNLPEGDGRLPFASTG